MNILSVNAPQVGRKEGKDKIWNKLFDIVGFIPDTEKEILPGDLNGHIGEERVGYEAVQGYSCGLRNSEVERILEFAVAANLMIRNSLVKKQENQLITYESGGVANTVDYELTRVGDSKNCAEYKSNSVRRMVRQHQLLVTVFKFA